MNEQRAAEGVDHLQVAAKEMISAARAFLDVLEDLVKDPDVVASVVSAVGSVAQGAAEAVRQGSPGRGPGGGGSDEEPGEDGGVQHITVS